MKLTVLALKVARLEKGKKQVNIAQILEILKSINTITKGLFYKLIRAI